MADAAAAPPSAAGAEALPEDSDAHVEVAPSRIPGAGSGLFATRAHRAGTAICVYRGRVLRTAEAVRLPREEKDYLMRLGPQVYVDARSPDSCLARFVNDAQRADRQNAYFDKRPDERLAVVVALRDIAAGEEIYASYGRWYWLKARGSVAPPLPSPPSPPSPPPTGPPRPSMTAKTRAVGVPGQA